MRDIFAKCLVVSETFCRRVGYNEDDNVILWETTKIFDHSRHSRKEATQRCNNIVRKRWCEIAESVDTQR
jgi:hypothetical protein